MLPFPQHLKYVNDRVMISTNDGNLFTSDITTNDLSQIYGLNGITEQVESLGQLVSDITEQVESLGHMVSDITELTQITNESIEILNEKNVNVPLGHNPFIYTTGQPINQDVNRVYLDDEANLYARSDDGFPKPSALPDYYTGAVLDIDSEAQLTLDLLAAADYDILNITADIALTGPKTISKKLKIQSLNGSRITYSSISHIFTITSSEVWFDGVTFNNINTDNSANILNFSGLTNTKNFVTNCIFETNEFAISSNNSSIQITNNTFIYILVTTPDSHRYIFLTGCQGFVFINDNIFQGNGHINTQCIFISSQASNFLDGHLIIKNNVSQLYPVQRLLMVETSMVGANFSLYASSNNCVTTSGFIIFYVLPLSGVKQIYVYNNVETLAPGITGSKGIIGIDSGSVSVISFDTKVYSADNIVPGLRIDYTDLVNPDANQPRVIAYAASKFSTTQSYDVIVPFIKNLSGGGADGIKNPFDSDVDAAGFSISNLTNINGINVDDLGDKTQYMSTPLTLPPQTKFLHDVEADNFIKTGGTNQQYLMADGSSLQFSANSGNSNYYLYTNSTAFNIDPPDGEITYNNLTQSLATLLYISHRTRDDIDIEVFFKNISQIQDVYIQDQAISENYIRYNITGQPVITVDSKVTIPVAVIESLGTGSTSFGNNTRVLLSFFTNNIETDLRLSTLETKTQNITTNASGTNLTKNTSVILNQATNDSFVIINNSSVAKFIVSNTSVQILSNLDMNNNRIQDVAAPVGNNDAANKLYVDNSFLFVNNKVNTLQTKTQNITTYLSIETSFTKTSRFILNSDDLFVIENGAFISGAQPMFSVSQNSVQVINVPLDMSLQRIKNLNGPTDIWDAANKLYVDNAISNIPINTQDSSAYWARQPWTLRNAAADNPWRSICWSPERGLFVAVAIGGTNNHVMTSPNGINWTSQNASAALQWNAVCWSAERGLFVAVSLNGTGNRVMTSPNGIDWTSRTSAADNQWRSVCWSAELELFVAVSDNGSNRVMTSPNGITWTSRTSAADNAWRSVCWSAELGLFVAVSSTGVGNRVMTSPDGINWNTQLSANNNGWNSVCWSPELFLFVAVSLSGTNVVMTSINGIDWTSPLIPVPVTCQSVCWAKEVGLFVAVGGSNVITSPNGVNWTVRPGVGSTWNSVCWSPELFRFASVSEAGVGLRVMTSINSDDNNGVNEFGGIYLQLQSGPVINATEVEISLFQNVTNFSGLLCIPITKSVSAYQLKISGNITLGPVAYNYAMITTLKSGSLALSTHSCSVGSMANQHFELTYDITTRKVGSTPELQIHTSLVISTGSSFDYRGDLNVRNISPAIDLNNITPLDVTVRFNAAPNTIQVLQAVMRKIY